MDKAFIKVVLLKKFKDGILLFACCMLAVCQSLCAELYLINTNISRLKLGVAIVLFDLKDI